MRFSLSLLLLSLIFSMDLQASGLRVFRDVARLGIRIAANVRVVTSNTAGIVEVKTDDEGVAIELHDNGVLEVLSSFDIERYDSADLPKIEVAMPSTMPLALDAFAGVYNVEAQHNLLISRIHGNASVHVEELGGHLLTEMRCHALQTVSQLSALTVQTYLMHSSTFKVSGVMQAKAAAFETKDTAEFSALNAKVECAYSRAADQSEQRFDETAELIEWGVHATEHARVTRGSEIIRGQELKVVTDDNDVLFGADAIKSVIDKYSPSLKVEQE